MDQELAGTAAYVCAGQSPWQNSGAVLGKNIGGAGPSLFGRQQQALLCPIVQY